MATVRTLLAVTAVQSWETLQMDVTNAFLLGDLSDEVYMAFSQGYTGWGSRIHVDDNKNSLVSDDNGQRLVYKLLKSLYGLKQAPKCWFSKFSTTLLENDFAESEYRAMALASCEITWLTALLKDMGL